MTVRYFANFAEASTFAKRIAQEHKTIVHVVKCGTEFAVEIKVASVLPDSIPERPGYDRASLPASPLSKSLSSKPTSQLSPLADDRYCMECGDIIPPERVPDGRLLGADDWFRSAADACVSR